MTGRPMTAVNPTPEQLEIQALAREFAERELRPHAAAWDQARAVDDGVFAKLAEVGFLGMTVPDAHGGLGLDPLTYLLVLEELAWGDAAVTLSVAIHNGLVAGSIARHGTEEQRAALLPALAAGERLGAFALSEPQAGSDAGALATTATPDGTGWRLSGQKRWVTNGGRAGLAVVFARTDADKVGAFLVELPAPGWKVTRRETTMGYAASETVAVELDGVAVPADRVLGDPRAGFRLAMQALDVGRIGLAAQAVGIARAALEHALAYAVHREQFAQPIARFGGVQEKLAEMARRVTAARAVTHGAVARLNGTEGGADPRGPDALTAWAAMAKLTASETAIWVADEAVQVFGGYGYMRDYPVEKLMRDAKGTEIFEGTSEILRVVIAREILRDHTARSDRRGP
jgi:alkylation response protein AidB-like acyl-CoA dehydrogenase